MTAEQRTEVSRETVAEEEREAERVAVPDHSPTPEEEELADAAAATLEQSGDLAVVRAHHDEMTRHGAEVKGEGRIA
jgi:hypothetical protein